MAQKKHPSYNDILSNKTDLIFSKFISTKYFLRTIHKIENMLVGRKMVFLP